MPISLGATPVLVTFQLTHQQECRCTYFRLVIPQLYILQMNKKPFPYIACSEYQNEEAIKSVFPHLKKINTLKVSDWDNFNDYALFINSSNDDNIHKAIKYGIWTSTQYNNKYLSFIWEQAQKANKKVYLFFTTTKSQVIEGVAILNSQFYENYYFPYWWDNYKKFFLGLFIIEWVYIKNVYYGWFNWLKQSQSIQDCSYINSQGAQDLLKAFAEEQPQRLWIFDHFKIMDQRERTYLRMQDKNPQ